jgi:protein SCO1/2
MNADRKETAIGNWQLAIGQERIFARGEAEIRPGRFLRFLRNLGGMFLVLSALARSKALLQAARTRPGKRYFGRGFRPIANSQLPIALFVLSLPAMAQMGSGPMGVPAQDLPPNLGNVSFEQRLNAQVPLNAVFRNEFGETVRLGDYFNQGKPVVLVLVYYECPMLCTEVLNGLASTLRIMKLDLGKQYDVVTVSFDPKDTPELARAKKRAYLQRYGHPDAQNGWHFLVGDEADIHAVTDAVGFHYQWDPRLQQFAHATGIMVLTPEGHVSQYYYGVEYSPKDLRLGLVEASQNRIGTVVDQVLLYCYHYDPRTGRYGAVITNILKVAGIATILILGSVLVLLWKHEPRPQAR